MPTLHASLPKVILGLLLALWGGLGLWIALKAPFGSGTDESINYVAFAAAKNRWATEQDFHRHGINFFYYPPLYFLAFAPFSGDEPTFVADYPHGDDRDPNYFNHAGRRQISAAFVSRVPPPLSRLYRQAKVVSVALGLTVLIALVATLRLLFPGPSGWWVALLGATPVLFLPQFLYYQTLVNNDALVNTLGALATLAFTAAVLALEQARERRFLALSLAVAVCIGLAFLTKMSAPVLLPLACGLAGARYASDRGLARRTRAGRALRLLALLAVVIFISGGWWIGYKAWQGDWNSIAAQRLAHSWAVIRPEWLAAPGWWGYQVVQIVRSYYALFSGVLFIGVPDGIFLAWSALPLAVVGCAAAIAYTRVKAGRRPGAAESRPNLRRLLWITFAGVLLLNIGSILVNLRFFLAAYGRLLFPSLVAVHAAAAAIVAHSLRERPRVLATATLSLVLYAGLLFGWTFHYRMAAAVAQPPEDVRVLNGVVSNLVIGPVWDFRVEQGLVVPPGDLAALRVSIWRVNPLPQFGAALEGDLSLRFADGRSQNIKVLRTALGDSDLCTAWVELGLEKTVRLKEVTLAVLSLRGSPPAWLPELNQFNYNCSDGGEPARLNGRGGECGLCVAAVYRRQSP